MNKAHAPIEILLSEYLDEATFLWLQRTHAVNAPNYSPQQFADLDERLAAHIDGLRVAGEAGWKAAEAALENEGPEDFFPAAVLALEASDDRFDRLIERARGVPEVVPGLVSALGWVSVQYLGGRVKAMLADASPLKQSLALAACAMHRKDPGKALEHALASPAPQVRARALRTAGELGRTDLVPRIREALGDPKLEARWWATWSAVRLGDRGAALETLKGYALKTGPRQIKALQLALLALSPEAGHELLQELPDTPDARRLRIIGAGWIGSPRYAPWLLEQMKQPFQARIAAEAFVNITGADFNLEQLEALPPEDFEEGPTEDPDDENVELPEDIALPWPDQERINAWWASHQARFTAPARLFLGAPVSAESCMRILREGFQRQRVIAALQLALLQPGSVLFPTSAPAWRQQRLLGQRNA